MGTYALHYWMSNMNHHGQPQPNSHAKIVVFEGLDIQHKLLSFTIKNNNLQAEMLQYWASYHNLQT